MLVTLIEMVTESSTQWITALTFTTLNRVTLILMGGEMSVTTAYPSILQNRYYNYCDAYYATA